MNEIKEILARIEATHNAKGEDYASKSNEFENFERSSLLMSWFSSSDDKAFIWPIATKLSRLATLLNRKRQDGGNPRNESIEDSFLDLIVYAVLWWAKYKRDNSTRQELQPGSVINYNYSGSIAGTSIPVSPKKL